MVYVCFSSFLLPSLTNPQERPVAELVAATGAERTGGFTVFQNVLPAMKKGKLHAIGGIRGMWSLPIRQPVKSGGASFDRSQNPFKPEHDTLIISTDAIPSPGLSRVRKQSSTSSHYANQYIVSGTLLKRLRSEHYYAYSWDYNRRCPILRTDRHSPCYE